MLISVGKLSSIGEILTIRFAASPPPGERQSSDFDSLLDSFQFGGTVQDIPWFSQAAVAPPAKACVCAAVGVAFSASPPVSEDEVPEPADLSPVLSLSPRLQSDRTRPRKRSTGICFMDHTHTKGLEEQCASIPKRGLKSMRGSTGECARLSWERKLSPDCADYPARSGTTTAHALAPEEPNVYRSNQESRAALQRSAMFPAMVRDPDLRFAPLERGGVFWMSAVYKHYVPTGQGTA